MADLTATEARPTRAYVIHPDLAARLLDDWQGTLTGTVRGPGGRAEHLDQPVGRRRLRVRHVGHRAEQVRLGLGVKGQQPEPPPYPTVTV